MRQRLKRLYSPRAIPSWIIILWKIAETGDTMSSIIDWLSPAWQFLSSPVGTIVLLLIGFGILIYVVVKPEKKQTKMATELLPQGIKYLGILLVRIRMEQMIWEILMRVLSYGKLREIQSVEVPLIIKI